MSLISNALNLASAIVGGNSSVVLNAVGQSFVGFTSGSWDLSAEGTEQSATLVLFTDAPPPSMAYSSLVPGVEATLSAFGQLYLTGKIETRNGVIKKGKYTLTITLKSKGKALQKATAKLAKGQALNTTPKKLISELAKNAGCEVEYGDVEDELIKQHVCIGDRNTDREIKSIGRDRGYLVYETHEGKIRVEGDHEGTNGVDLVLGVNVEDAEVKMSSEKEKGKIKTVGTRNLSKETNRAATLTPPGQATMNSKIVGEFVQWVDGDQTPKSLRRRAIFEVNRRSAEAKEAKLQFATVLAPDGSAWRLNAKHFVQVPSEGLFDVLRVKSGSFSFDKEEMNSTITLVPIAGLSNKSGKSSSGASKAKAAIAKKAAGVTNTPTGLDWSTTVINDFGE